MRKEDRRTKENMCSDDGFQKVDGAAKDDSFFEHYDSPPLRVFFQQKENSKDGDARKLEGQNDSTVQHASLLSKSNILEEGSSVTKSCLRPSQSTVSCQRKKLKPVEISKGQKEQRKNDIRRYFVTDMGCSLKQFETNTGNRKSASELPEGEIGSFIDEYDSVPLRNRSEKKIKERRYQPGPCRKQEDRKRIRGFECACCKPYYDALNLSPEARKERVNVTSRHRAKVTPPKTPEHHWEISIPGTQDCQRRGLIYDSPYVSRRNVYGRKLYTELRVTTE